MDRKRAAELLPVIQAFADGRAIEWRLEGEKWNDATLDGRLCATSEVNDIYEYRIKPESREWWLNTRTAEAYVTKECAEKFALGEKIVHLREVIE